MEVAYLLTAEIPSEFHCAQFTTFHIQHVVKHLNENLDNQRFTVQNV